MKILIATHNKHKLQEMARILEPMGYEVVTDRDIGIELTDVEENGITFIENARIKAKSGCDESGLICIADDSGLCVDALDGEPGVYSARYCGEHGNDSANNEKLLLKLKDVADENRTARFVCAICVCFPEGSEITAEGVCEGKIGYEYRGNNGFGYDPLFMVGNKSFAELTAEEKDAISHRGNALKKLKELLPTV
ncbi:MAG: XTP/dITP diphosphatase [Acutalibacteraceae bacterium]|nr:XTP/dITP diphosphatase [Acutalibacteraceae bacterium]